MKRFLPIVPLVLLLLLNACANSTAALSAAQWDAVIQTQTATMWTAVPTQTYNPNIPNMINSLNTDLQSTAHSLGSTMDAKYSVTDITFPNHSRLTFRIDVNCICMNNANCCIPERTFVVILESLKRNSTATLAQVPSDVSQMMVVCFDKANSQIGAMSASWQDVQGYFQGYVSGYQLGVRVTRTAAP